MDNNADNHIKTDTSSKLPKLLIIFILIVLLVVGLYQGRAIDFLGLVKIGEHNKKEEQQESKVMEIDKLHQSNSLIEPKPAAEKFSQNKEQRFDSSKMSSITGIKEDAFKPTEPLNERD